tara:strand:+ start:3369 stop:3752 length:384 start_codon:yes stop_codon:yes gene_type:complete
MSIHGHYNKQYYGNRIQFPYESFTIAGISRYIDNCSGIDRNTELYMKKEPQNPHDPSAISIIFEDKKIGYVPVGGIAKNLCFDHIDDPLKIINIKSGSHYGIRVIPKRFYQEDTSLENQVMFADENQ